MNKNYFRLRIILGLLIVFLNSNLVSAEFSHQFLDQVLAEHVDDGKIAFTQLCRDKRLDQYIDQLKETNPDAIARREDRFAFWLNVYNAYSLDAVCAKYPIKSINDLNFGGLIVSVVLKKSVWDKPFVVVNGREHTLREVDHEILRPTFKDPRIQFAIACGAIGCAPSRSEAYHGDRLDRQLDEQARIFINDQRNNSFNLSKKKARLSPLFDWSKKDFGKNNSELLLYLSQYLPDEFENRDPK